MIKRIVVDRMQLRMVRSMLRTRNTYFMVGLNSIYVPSRQEKWLDKAVVRDWPDLEGEIVPMTPGEAARTELRREFGELKRIGWKRDHVALLDARWPMYYSGKFFGDGVYIDIKSAYYQIYSRLWLDVCFPRGMGTLDLGPVGDRLKHWKPARNGVIGVCISRNATGIKGPRRIKVPTTNPFLSPHLWATIQGILNELAMAAIELGAVYVATDGYIFPSHKPWDVFKRFLKEIGLQFHFKHTDIDIRGWSSYRVGQFKETVPYTKGEQGGQGRVYQVEMPMGEPMALVDWWANSIPKYRGIMKNVS